ncbi:hypothetical protein NNC19_08015 [Clostridium sp. SHJSY1]|uniref:hypothetical protein n=1 Tax=Clostridium sp. SHJSY1 TaxID=2942483 RepID=UPI00287459B0|nr:hypothetical protein [Clostridium sp. SHJSY1]MDS0525619.1 hypothetical protein [Clostridium sp. SHJSY1]
MSTASKSNELIVLDNEYSYASKKFTNYADYLNEAINEYIRVLEYVISYGINDEKITESLNGLLNEVKRYPDAIQSVSQEISEIINEYLSKIDSADKFLY